MKKRIALTAVATTVAAASLSLGTPAHAQAAPAKPVATATKATTKYPTKTVCAANEGLCLTVPASWADKKQVDRGPEFPAEFHTVGSTWTRFIEMQTGSFFWEGFCSPEEPFFNGPNYLVRSAKTAAVTKKGQRLYAVTWVSSTGGNWHAQTELTPSAKLATSKVSPACTGAYDEYFDGRRTKTVHVGKVSDGRLFKSKEQAIAWANGVQHRMAFNVLATARYGK